MFFSSSEFRDLELVRSVGCTIREIEFGRLAIVRQEAREEWWSDSEKLYILQDGLLDEVEPRLANYHHTHSLI